MNAAIPSAVAREPKRRTYTATNMTTRNTPSPTSVAPVVSAAAVSDSAADSGMSSVVITYGQVPVSLTASRLIIATTAASATEVSG